jgi:hypothetical protein
MQWKEQRETRAEDPEQEWCEITTKEIIFPPSLDLGQQKNEAKLCLGVREEPQALRGCPKSHADDS